MLPTPAAEQIWVASIADGALVLSAAAIVEQGTGSVTLALRGQATFARGAEALLTYTQRGNEQRLGRILEAESHTVRVALAERTVQI